MLGRFLTASMVMSMYAMRLTGLKSAQRPDVH